MRRDRVSFMLYDTTPPTIIKNIKELVFFITGVESYYNLHIWYLHLFSYIKVFLSLLIPPSISQYFEHLKSLHPRTPTPLP